MTSHAIPGVKLTQFQSRVWAWVQERRHLPQGICQAAESLARLFGCTQRYVQKALKFFVDLGVLRRVSDYGLRTRRRFFVVGTPVETPLFASTHDTETGPAQTNSFGAESTPVQTNSFGEPQFVHQTNPSSFTNDLPPDPPIVVSGENSDLGSGGKAPEPPPLDVRALEPNEEQLNALVGQAREAMPEHTPPPAWVRNLVLGFGVDWVRAAFRRAQQRRKAGATIQTGYVIATLKGFAEDGCAPPELLAPPPPPEVLMSKEEWIEKAMAKLASFSPRGG